MNTRDRFRNFEVDFINQFKALPGGLESSTSFIDAPVSAEVLSKASRKLRRLNLGDALWLCVANDRLDILRALIDLVDHQKGPGDLAKVSRQDVIHSASLMDLVEKMEEDGHRAPHEIREVQRMAEDNAAVSAEVLARAKRLQPGPVED